VSRNKGRLYPADPPAVEEIVAVMREAGDDRHGYRLRALIVVLRRGGLRVAEAPALGERDLDPSRGSLLVRSGKGGRGREIGMGGWGWEQLSPWLAARLELPVGPLFCVIDGPTRGRPWSSANVRVELHRLAAHAGTRRRFAPHQLRHAHAVELAREACRSPSSSASSATPTSARRASTFTVDKSTSCQAGCLPRST
jgi:site-specific recombinase XerD